MRYHAPRVSFSNNKTVGLFWVLLYMKENLAGTRETREASRAVTWARHVRTGRSAPSVTRFDNHKIITVPPIRRLSTARAALIGQTQNIIGLMKRAAVSEAPPTKSVTIEICDNGARRLVEDKL